MLRLGRNALLGVAVLLATTAQAAEYWREQALKASDRLAQRIELLDEALHEAYEHHATPAFKKAIEDIHHIEEVVEHLDVSLKAAPFAQCCQDFHHLYEDLVQIRLDLIALGLEHNPQVVQTWNAMVNVYNNELAPWFRNCPPHSWGRGSKKVGNL